MPNKGEVQPLLPASTIPHNSTVHTSGANNFSKPNPIIAIRHAGHIARPGHISLWRVLLVFVLLVIPLLLLANLELPDLPWPGSPVHTKGLCPQVEALYPVVHEKIARKVAGWYESPEFLNVAVASLSGAVKVPYVL